ncbi:MAG: putative succinyl-diaminopimelate desuccinylase [Syntrophorhabdus sp. PtaU1.Bin002]|nr:MAG: putative succinyl-diaminopimelate desuccinylase [Syntrophorhabdus sp. PtaU1.Bin002]
MNDVDRAVSLLSDLIRIDTSNPPGNEEEAVLFLESYLRKEGLSTEIFPVAPKRANLMARLKGKNKEKPIVLLSHIDVVPAKADDWEVPPFSGEVRDGFIYGRGAIDMKSQTVCQLLALTQLHKDRLTPQRDIIFLATCDEEVGGQYGVEYMLKEVGELRHASFVLSEGGCIIEENGHLHAQVSVAEKKLSQFAVTAKGTGGHGSMPHHDNANEKVLAAANGIMSYQWPLKPTGVVTTYLNGILKGEKGKGFVYTNLRETLHNKRFREFVENNPVYNALLRNTVTATILKGGEKVNVIPTESSISFDARLLPSEDRRAFFRKIRVLAGKDVEIIPIGAEKNDPPQSGYNTPYFRGIRKAMKKVMGPIPVLPFVTTGATDLRHFRDLGIPAYGFFPITLSNQELFRMHGLNERISVRNMSEGLSGTYEILKFLATA